MATPRLLNTEAEACRKALADWSSQAQKKADYVLDERGNRIYDKDRIESLAKPLSKAMGLEGRDVTMWRISTYTRMKPDPPTVYVIPIQILSSPPRVMKDGNKCEIVPGSYTVIKGSFELMPGSDYLLYGSEEDNPQTD